jgi:hypothetical protein
MKSFIFFGTMGKRTPQSGLSSWEDAPALEVIVVDKRPTKRAGRAKARRRDRRYENRLLRTTLEALEEPNDEWLAAEQD